MIPASPEPDNSLPVLEAPPESLISPVPPRQIDRDTPDPSEARSALVKKMQGEIKRSVGIFDKIFTQMRKDQRFLRGRQWESDVEDEDKYVANITQRLINQKVSALYAKDPTFVCRRRKQMDFKIWDGERASLMPLASILSPQPQPIMGPNGMPLMDPLTHAPVMGPPPPPDPNAVALLQDVQQGLAKRFMMNRVAETVEIVIKHQIEQQTPPFKLQMKQKVRRVCTNSVGYTKVGYQRFLERRPEDADRITDITQRIADISVKEADYQDGEINETSAEVAQLQSELEALQSDKGDHISREGMVYDFPSSTSIIVDPACRQLSGFVGAAWIAQEYFLDPSDVKEIFGKDVQASNAQQPTTDAQKVVAATLDGSKNKEDNKKIRCWERYEKKSGLVYWLADGYADFLQEPAPPKIKLKRFWPWIPLIFNEAENEEQIYPPSDVSLMRPMQLEYNRARNGLREHRFANRPATVVADGALDPKDEEKLSSFPRNALLKLRGLQPGQKIEDLIQSFKRPAIDPNIYQTSDISNDIQLVMGAQEANLGNPGDGTATGQGIAESSRMSGISSNIDDLEDVLTEIGQCTAEVLLAEMDVATVQDIAGIGAVWPTLTPQDIINALYVEVEGGSSGRPNKAVDIANAEKLLPLLMQIPGIPPEKLVELIVQRLDDKLDVTDFVADGLESIVSQNRGAQPPAQGANMAAGDPHMQGPAGGAPPGAMHGPPGGPAPASGPVGPAHQSVHAPLSGPAPGQQRPSAFVNPANV